MDSKRAERLRLLQQLFTQWTEEDAQLSDQDADRLDTALEPQRGVQFRSPTID